MRIIREVSTIVFLFDDSLFSEGLSVSSHRDHAFIGTSFYSSRYLLEFSFCYEIPDTRCDVHDLTDSDTSLHIFPRDESLWEYTDEWVCDTSADLRSDIRGEELYDTRKRLYTSCCMKRRKYEMSCLCEAHRYLHRFCISYLTDHDDICIFSHRWAYRMRKWECISSDFSLREEGFFIVKYILYRIFDRDDVLTAEFIDRFEHRSHSRRLSTSCRSCDEKESLLGLEYFRETFWESEFDEIFDIFWYTTQRYGDPPHVHIGISPIWWSIFLTLVSEVDLEIVLEVGDTLFLTVYKGIEKVEHLELRRSREYTAHSHITFYTKDEGFSFFDMDIGCAELDALLEEIFEDHREK